MGGIFISYRREDSGPYAGRLRDTLSRHFGAEQVFRDLDTINPGERFRRVIEQAVGSCDVLLAVIGPTWLSIKDDTGERRLNDPDDYLRLEIATALARSDVLAIPVLVGTTSMPAAVDLPKPLASLAECNAVRLSDEDWDDQVAHLIRALDKVVQQPVAPSPLSGPGGPGVPPPWQPRASGPMPSAQPPKRNNLPIIIGAIAATILLLGGAGIALLLINKSDKNKSNIATSTTASEAMTSQPPVNTTGSKWVVIMYSPATGAFGWANNLPSRDEASELAMNNCKHYGGTDCQEAAWASNQCVALAKSDTSWRGSFGETIQAAEQDAIAENNGGAILISKCST